MLSSIIHCLPLNSSRSFTSSWPKCHLLWSGRGHRFCKDWAWCQPYEASRNPQRRKHSTGCPVDFRELDWWQEKDIMGRHNQTISLTQHQLFPMEVCALQLSSSVTPSWLIQSRSVGFFSCRGPERTHCWNGNTYLQRYGSLSLHRDSDQWHGLLSAPLSAQLILPIHYKITITEQRLAVQTMSLRFLNFKSTDTAVTEISEPWSSVFSWHRLVHSDRLCCPDPLKMK